MQTARGTGGIAYSISSTGKMIFIFIFPFLSCIFLLSGTRTNAMSSKSSQRPKRLSLGVSSWCFTDILPSELVASSYICSCILEIAAKIVGHTGIFFVQDEKIVKITFNQ